jgi:tetratricopeptide (TPR) repeat protein
VRAAPARPAPPPPPPPEPEPEPEVDLTDEIGEAEFFVEQGLLDEARDALHNLLAFYPDHPAVLAKLAEVERKAKPAPPAASSPAAEPGAGADAAFDIARELADELGGGAGAAPEDEFQYSVEDVFSQFKRGVEQTVKKEDSATHYDLGIAYKEMGLLDDAIHEFETALAGNDRRREVDCLSMIGLCRMQKGEATEAAKAFRRALGSDHLSKDAAKAIHYELAGASERSGDKDAALYYLQKVARADPAFRDAAKRIVGMGGGAGRAPPEEQRPAGAPRPPATAPAARPPASAGGAQKKNIGYL